MTLKSLTQLDSISLYFMDLDPNWFLPRSVSFVLNTLSEYGEPLTPILYRRAIKLCLQARVSVQVLCLLSQRSQCAA